MNKYYIEELRGYNNKISLYNLIYSKIKLDKWLVIAFFVIPTFISAMLCNWDRLGWLFLTIPLVIVSFVVSARLLRKEVKKVIIRDFDYAIDDEGGYSYKSFLEIQKMELCKLLGNDLIKKENLIFLMEKTPNNSERYAFGFTIAVISLIATIITGTFLGKFLDFATDMKDFINGSKSLILVLLFYGLLFIVIDVSLIKMMVLQHKKNQNRLIRTMENIYLEKYIKD